MSTERMNQLNSELRDLCAELQSLQARALDRVEELENSFDLDLLPPEVHERFRTMQRLVMKV